MSKEPIKLTPKLESIQYTKPVQPQQSPQNNMPLNLQISPQWTNAPTTVKNNPWQRSHKEKREKASQQRKENQALLAKTIALKNKLLKEQNFNLVLLENSVLNKGNLPFSKL